jgi:hypothetical protein
MFDMHIIDPVKEDDDAFEMTVHLISSPEPIKFGLEPDEVKSEDDDEGFNSQLQNLFFDLDSAEDEEIIWFDDEDAERVYINVKHVLLLEVPLICCEPDLLRKSFDGLREDEEDGYQGMKISKLRRQKHEQE